MSTYAHVHAGDVVLGHDGQEWGVRCVVRSPAFAVTLTRYGEEVTGYPDPTTEVEILTTADTIEERRAFDVLAKSFGDDIELVGEVWTS